MQIKFDEQKYNARPVAVSHGYRLRITAGGDHIQEAFDTVIKEHLALHVFDFVESYPDLPRLAKSTLVCDFCLFLRSILLSKEVAFAIADHGVNLKEDKFTMGVRLQYS